jgi:hypothetical protein
LGVQSAADLCPREGSLGMNLAAQKYQAYLLGSSGSLSVAVAHAEAAQSVTSPYPALQRCAELAPGESLAVQLRCCAGFDKPSLEKSCSRLTRKTGTPKLRAFRCAIKPTCCE